MIYQPIILFVSIKPDYQIFIKSWHENFVFRLSIFGCTTSPQLNSFSYIYYFHNNYTVTHNIFKIKLSPLFPHHLFRHVFLCSFLEGQHHSSFLQKNICWRDKNLIWGWNVQIMNMNIKVWNSLPHNLLMHVVC